ncbi:proteasome assembly chaperone 4 [Nasonia vitripennis]|uniref:Proteasome assembly chaperone 4 n=1 Tax=Nasonia vitripennis TaxID=7425 RepID=A0A7M7IUQ0_NASVI|nr:proteasome assembly chaperone 4 [Nasonia vitripennis]XP_016845360.1 proteasome assembly chaperone 4 [Nasonia vitripennis]
MVTVEDPELLPCSFQFHNFHDQVGEVRLQCQIMKMDQSLYLWVGDYNDRSMKDLALAFAMDKKPAVSTKIMGPIADEISCNVASRLAKKTGKPVYVSFNVNVDNLTLPNVEKRIHEEFKKHPELLAF